MGFSTFMSFKTYNEKLTEEYGTNGTKKINIIPTQTWNIPAAFCKKNGWFCQEAESELTSEESK
jgi:hypothetical protein